MRTATAIFAALSLAACQSQPSPFDRFEEPEPQVEVWVGALCNGGGMVVSSNRDDLADANCYDEWKQTLTESQVTGEAE